MLDLHGYNVYAMGTRNQNLLFKGGSMAKSTDPVLSTDSMHGLEHIAQLVRTSRNPFATIDRVLPALTEVLGARGGAIVLSDVFSKRQHEWASGDDQRQIIQMGRELVDGVEAHGQASARHTALPGAAPGRAPEGMVLSTPLTGVQEAVGVMVFFCLAQPAQQLETALTCLNVAGNVLGCLLQTANLQERLKAQADAANGPAAQLSAGYNPDQIVGQSDSMKSIMHEIRQAANSRSTILLRGESGTGKELVARALHKQSARRQQPFVKLNCAALPETLLESELFGHEKGAFTGAVKTRRGRFELADSGTLFLDEIGDMSLAMQVKLLRVLQERNFERVGGHRPISVDVRIIAATNVDLEDAVRHRRFREDLYYRLHVVPIVMPSLRERREDIPSLVGHFLARFNSENRRSLKISSAAMDLIIGYDWPGNIRELENCVERMVVMTRRDIVAPEDVPLSMGPGTVPLVAEAALQPSPSEGRSAPLPKAVADIERERLVEALQTSGGVQTRAAMLLGITPRQLGYRLKKYRIEPKTLIG